MWETVDSGETALPSREPTNHPPPEADKPSLHVRVFMAGYGMAREEAEAWADCT